MINFLNKAEMIGIQLYRKSMFGSHSQEKFRRIFQLKDQASQKKYLETFDLTFSQKGESINITEVIHYFASIENTIKNSSIWFIDQSRQRNIYLGTYHQQQIFHLPIDSFQLDTIKLLYKSNLESISEEIESPKKKIRERTIEQALQVVSEWINLYDLTDQNGIKIHTLQSASQIVGVSKKTLHDYHKHIKLAEKRQFNFSKNSHKKIGFMKKFIRQHEEKSKEKNECLEKKQYINPDEFWSLQKKKSGKSQQ